MPSIQLDLSRLYGFKIVADQRAQTTVAPAFDKNAVAKVGGKLGAKAGTKLGVKAGTKLA
jgi:hypothetical protein